MALLMIAIIIILLRIYTLLCPSLWMWWQGCKIPGPAAFPIIGNGLIFLQPNKTSLQILEDLVHRYGKVLRLWFGKELVVVISNPEDAQAILMNKKCLQKPGLYKLGNDFIGKYGLVQAPEEIWYAHRKQLIPSFGNQLLENYVEIMTNNAEIMSNQLKHKVNCSEFDIFEYFEKCSLDIICETSMGIEPNIQAFQNDVYFTCLKNINRAILERWLHPWLHIDFIFRRTKLGKIYYESVSKIKGEVTNVIKERKRILFETVTSTENEEMKSGCGKKHLPFLDYMLLKSDFNDEEILDEVQTFIFAGYDTSATTMSFCIYLLAKHQHIQDKVVKEILDVLPRGERTMNDYNNMKYLDNVLKESLRLYTTVPITGRTVEETLTLPSGYTIPAGGCAILFYSEIHRDERNYPNHEEFIPERFDDEDSRIHFYAWAPFSKGLRYCVGKKFAMLEMKIIISTLLLRYKFLPADKVTSLTLNMEVTLCSAEGIPIKIVPRNLTIDE